MYIPITSHLRFLKFNSKQILPMLLRELYSTRRRLYLGWHTSKHLSKFLFSSVIDQVTFCLHCEIWIVIFQLGKDPILWNKFGFYGTIDFLPFIRTASDYNWLDSISARLFTYSVCKEVYILWLGMMWPFSSDKSNTTKVPYLPLDIYENEIVFTIFKVNIKYSRTPITPAHGLKNSQELRKVSTSFLEFIFCLCVVYFTLSISCTRWTSCIRYMKDLILCHIDWKAICKAAVEGKRPKNPLEFRDF